MKKLILSTLVLLSVGCAQMKKKTAEPAPVEPAAVVPTKAQAVLKPAPGYKVKGIVHFTTENNSTKIETNIEGLKAGPHGFHIHEVGDCSKPDFSSAGGHFNPTAANHGDAHGDKRHAGDLGNIIADTKKKAKTSMTAEGLSMSGANSIIGKAVVIHKDKDDLKSQPAGNSGARIACGVIEAL